MPQRNVAQLEVERTGWGKCKGEGDFFEGREGERGQSGKKCAKGSNQEKKKAEAVETSCEN